MTTSVNVSLVQFAPGCEHLAEGFWRHGEVNFGRAIRIFSARPIANHPIDGTIKPELRSGDKFAWHSVRHTHPPDVKRALEHGCATQGSEVNGRGFRSVNGFLPSALCANSPLSGGVSYRIRPSAGMVVPGFWFCVSGVFRGLISPFVRFLDRVGGAEQEPSEGQFPDERKTGARHVKATARDGKNAC